MGGSQEGESDTRASDFQQQIEISFDRKGNDMRFKPCPQFARAFMLASRVRQDYSLSTGRNVISVFRTKAGRSMSRSLLIHIQAGSFCTITSSNLKDKSARGS